VDRWWGCLGPGPRLVDGVELLADLLHPCHPGQVPDGVAYAGVTSA
jgi:hypothetical protein